MLKSTLLMTWMKIPSSTLKNAKSKKLMFGGVGTKLITAYDQPALGAVYKIVSVENEAGEMINTIKLSNNAEKVSTPGKKQVWRITSREKVNQKVTTSLMME